MMSQGDLHLPDQGVVESEIPRFQDYIRSFYGRYLDW